MARFKGDSSGRNVVQYADAKVAAACTDLCTHVNNEVSALNTNKLSTSGSGANLTNVVHSITAGTGISVNQATGSVTVEASGGGADGAVEVLYNCAQCWNGSASIPSSKRGAFAHYEMIGQTNYWHNYCSMTSYCFEAWPGCSNQPQASYCCAHCSCGWIGANKCFYSSRRYDCAGTIPWSMGCESGCYTACSAVGFQFHNRISAENACNPGNKMFRYCFNTTMNGGDICCLGVRNSGVAHNCCGMSPACLKGVCYTTQSAINPFGGHHTSMTILGYGRLPV